MLFGNIVGAIDGVSTALNAYNNKKANKYIARENRKIADMQFEYNKKEISRAFDNNLRAILREQANERVGAINEAKQMLDNINMATGNNANVDDESFEHDIKDKTSKDIADSMIFMLDTHKMGLEELANTKVAQTYNLGLNYSNVLSSINNREIALNEKYNARMAYGLIKAGTSAYNAFSQMSGDTTAEETESEYNFKEYDSNYFANSLSNFGMQPYNPYKKNYGF